MYLFNFGRGWLHNLWHLNNFMNVNAFWEESVVLMEVTMSFLHHQGCLDTTSINRCSILQILTWGKLYLEWMGGYPTLLTPTFCLQACTEWCKAAYYHGCLHSYILFYLLNICWIFSVKIPSLAKSVKYSRADTGCYNCLSLVTNFACNTACLACLTIKITVILSFKRFVLRKVLERVKKYFWFDSIPMKINTRATSFSLYVMVIGNITEGEDGERRWGNVQPEVDLQGRQLSLEPGVGFSFHNTPHTVDAGM